MADSTAVTAYKYTKQWLAMAPGDLPAPKLVSDGEGYLEEEWAFEQDMKQREEIIQRETPADRRDT